MSYGPPLLLHVRVVREWIHSPDPGGAVDVSAGQCIEVSVVYVRVVVDFVRMRVTTASKPSVLLVGPGVGTVFLFVDRTRP